MKILKKYLIMMKYKKSKIYSNYVSIHSKLSRGVRIYKDAFIDKNVSIGRYTYISENCKIYSGTNIGSFCSIAPNVIISPGEHKYTNFTTHPLFYDNSWNKLLKFSLNINKVTTIGNDVWIGCNAIIKSGVTISDGTVIGAGAVVTKDIPPYAIVAGNPAKIIKFRFEPKKIKKILNEQWWEKNIDEILKMPLDRKEMD